MSAPTAPTGPSRPAPVAAALDRNRTIPLGRRASFLLTLVSLFGLAAFCWPLIIIPPLDGANGAHAVDAPFIFALVLPVLVGLVVAELLDGTLDAKAVAVLAVLAACGVALRFASPGVAGFEPVFFLLVPAGRVFGRSFGFVLGALTLLASALLTGGVGPWLPFQMLGAAWVGCGAGCLPPARGRAEVALLAAYGVVAALVYGLLLNLWFWPFAVGPSTGLSHVPGAPLTENLGNFLTFHLATSLGWDIPRAVMMATLMVVLGPAVLAALRRVGRRAAFGEIAEFTPSS